MANMSYCRFYNTVMDLEDCAEHMDDDLESVEEERARKRLLKLCVQIALDSGLVEECEPDDD